MVKATLKFPPLDKGWRIVDIDWPATIFFYNEAEKFGFEIIPYDENFNYNLEEWEIEIPAGVYDMCSKFERIDYDNVNMFSDTMFYEYYYIEEGISIGENSIIELKPEESTVCMKMETINPNGEKSRLQKISYNEDWDREIVEEGNITGIYVHKVVMWRDIVIDNNIKFVPGYCVEPGPFGSQDPQIICNFYVNSVSDNYMFRTMKYMPAWPESEGVYLAVTQCRGAVEGSYTNDIKYSLDESVIEHTPAFEQYPPIDFIGDGIKPYKLSITAVFPDRGQDENGICIPSEKSSVWKVWSSGPANVYNGEELYLTYNKNLDDAWIIEEKDWGTRWEIPQILGENIYPFADNHIVNTVNPQGIFGYYENGEMEPYNLFPGNPYFKSYYSQQMIAVGGSAPLLHFNLYPAALNLDTGSINTVYKYCYIGRMGERLNSTENLANAVLSVNSEKIAEGFYEPYNWLTENPNVKGEYSFTVTADNFSIGDIKGGNIAKIVYNNDNDDITPPTVTMLQLRDQMENITQEFANSDDCKFLISAADYSFNFGEPNEWGGVPVWFDLSAPAKVSAWCTPNGVETNVISEIELTQDVDAGIVHGFGALYRGSLDKLNLMSPNGWYDLTISVEDAAGNSQVQTLSPAFKIDTLTGINAITTDASVTVNGNEIVAPAGSRIYNIGGAEVGNKLLSKGIYLVVTPEKTVKVAVR